MMNIFKTIHCTTGLIFHLNQKEKVTADDDEKKKPQDPVNLT